MVRRRHAYLAPTTRTHKTTTVKTGQSPEGEWPKATQIEIPHEKIAATPRERDEARYSPSAGNALRRVAQVRRRLSKRHRPRSFSHAAGARK